VRWLVTGAGGMLGRDLVVRLGAERDDVVGLGHADLDIADPPSVRRALDAHRPQVVVNCAAYTAVDAAESDEVAALRVNGTGPRVVAEACASTGARLLQVSTDYVFDGTGAEPYPEDAKPDPRTAYGRTKLAGEEAVLDLLPETGVVVRTAWLYARHGSNFVRTMVRLESERDTLDVVADQRGQPTWTYDVAERLVLLGRRPEAAGVFHATSAGETTWCELTREIFRLLGADPERVRPTTTDRVPRPAPRPAYSVLGHDRWAELGLDPIRPWRDALREAFATMS
jgi:dTDP-4-dehydrorhamnose reductase